MWFNPLKLNTGSRGFELQVGAHGAIRLAELLFVKPLQITGFSQRIKLACGNN